MSLFLSRNILHGLLQVSSLDDVKTVSQSDNNAGKTMALDHLGVIAARIRTSTLKIEKTSSDGADGTKNFKTMDEVNSLE